VITASTAHNSANPLITNMGQQHAARTSPFLVITTSSPIPNDAHRPPLRPIEHTFKLLNMRSATADLTTRARIRDAAVVVFGQQGFSTGVRAVATAAGVSPGLVNHHFGSKEGLRAVCDDYVLDVIRTDKADFLTSPSASSMIAKLADIEQYAPLIAYILRSFQTGGTLAELLFEHMVTNAELYLAEGVAAGTLRPSRDPAARARYAAIQGLGGLLLYFQLHTNGENVDYAKALREYSDATTLPALELYTDGMLTDSSLLDGYLENRSTTAEQEM